MKLEKIIALRNDKTVYRYEDKVVKLFNDNYSKTDILNEALNQARVEETGLNIPKLYEVTKIDGKWAIIMEFVWGKTLDQIIKENAEKGDEYLESFVDLQMETHQQKAPLLNKLKEKMKRKIAETNLTATTRYELQTRLNSMPNRDNVCHGDFNPANIIVTPKGESYIIDWSHVTQGNAAADVARTYLLFWLKGDITTAEKYMDLFCKKSNTEKKFVQKWIPIVAASQLTKGKKPEREFLMHWIDVVDYE